jgi:hypothetical protein
VIVMFSMIRRRLCYANIVATLALVFAMSGGALAAGHYLLSSTKQISPQVLKALRGKSGAPGADGAQGPAGSQGTAGPQGPVGMQGTKGEAGPAGAKGAAGAAGVQGPKGQAGSPWTAGGTLPSGETETGDWATSGGPEDGLTSRFVLASYAIPLAEAPSYNFIGRQEGEGQTKENEKAKQENEERKLKGEPELPLPIPADCKGTWEHPGATAGNLCVFETSSSNAEIPKPEAALIGTTGVLAHIETPISTDEGYSARGTWAVTSK